MKNIRLFIVSCSLLLSVWLGASYVTETGTPAGKQEASLPSSSAQKLADTGVNEQSDLEATSPVSYIINK